jgi:hypothetical protein
MFASHLTFKLLLFTSAVNGYSYGATFCLSKGRFYLHIFAG